MMREAGYPDDFSAGITAASAILGPIIPPSNSMILYATIAGNIPVVMLFLGGIVPGLIIAALLMAYCYYVSKKKKYPVTGKRAKLKDILRAFISCFPALLMPIIILGGILSGLFTATESAAIAVVYAVFVTKFVYRTFNYKKFISNLINTPRNKLTGWEYDEEKDVAYSFDHSDYLPIKLAEGDFAIFFPQDAHRKVQSSGDEGYHKIVLKVPITGFKLLKNIYG